eukprot:XP_017945623.1 PREDICTED: zinc finger MYND domain-containing protein 15 [Xenopus tropicalis]
MEFSSGYQDPLLEFSEGLLRWSLRYLMDRGPRERLGLSAQESQLASLPYDNAVWLLHIIPNRDRPLRPVDPKQPIANAFYDDVTWRFHDLNNLTDLCVWDQGQMGDGEAGRCSLCYTVPVHLHWSLLETSDGNVSSLPDGLCRVHYLLMVADETGNLLGMDFVMAAGQEKQTDQQMLPLRLCELLCQCMEKPMAGGRPRRPKMVAVADANLHASLSRLLTSLGIHLQEALFQDWTLHTDFIFSSKMAQKCHVCKKRSFEAPVKICTGGSCPKLPCPMHPLILLSAFPPPEVTSPWFDKERFLSARQLTGGYWSSESIHHHARGLLLKRDGQEPEEERPEALMEDTDIMLRDYPTEGPKNILGTWKEYYEWRNLSLDNPIAALLSYPLTIYHVISSLLPQHFPALNFQKKQTLRIHIIAGRREFERILLFWELAVLMPHPTIELVFVGEELPPEEDGRSFILHRKGPQVQRSDLSGPAKGKDGRQIHVKVHAHQYHSLQAAKPDLILVLMILAVLHM